MAKLGEVVNHSGACSASANPFIFAKGFKPNSSAFSLLIKTKAAAPSFMVLALAAVTVPSLINTGFKVGIFSKFTFLYSSSSENKTSPFFVFTVISTTSSLNLPALHAAADFL